MNKLPAALDPQLQRDAQLTHFDYFILVLLAESPNQQMQLARLAEEAGASLSRLSHVVTKLENAGWLRRERLHGTRGSAAVLTEAGAEKVSAASRRHMETVQRLVLGAVTPAQLRQVERISNRILERITSTTD